MRRKTPRASNLPLDHSEIDPHKDWTHFHFHSRFFFPLFASLRTCGGGTWPEKKYQFRGTTKAQKKDKKKIKFIFVITLNRSGPESLRTDSLAFFSILSKRVINKGKVSVWRGNFPTPTQKRRCVCMCRDSIHVLLVPPNHKKRKGPSLSRPYNKILWDLSPLVVIFQRIYPEKIRNKINK